MHNHLLVHMSSKSKVTANRASSKIKRFAAQTQDILPAHFNLLASIMKKSSLKPLNRSFKKILDWRN